MFCHPCTFVSFSLKQLSWGVVYAEDFGFIFMFLLLVSLEVHYKDGFVLLISLIRVALLPVPFLCVCVCVLNFILRFT